MTRRTDKQTDQRVQEIAEEALRLARLALAGGDVASQPNILRDTILNGNGTARYVGANALERRTTSSLGIGTPGFANPAAGDYSLDVGSAAIGAAITGDDLEADLATQAAATGSAENLGASITALRMWRYWSQQNLT